MRRMERDYAFWGSGQEIRVLWGRKSSVALLPSLVTRSLLSTRDWKAFLDWNGVGVVWVQGWGVRLSRAFSTSELLCNFEEVMVKTLGPKWCVIYLYACWVFVAV